MIDFYLIFPTFQCNVEHRYEKDILKLCLLLLNEKNMFILKILFRYCGTLVLNYHKY